MMGRESKYKDSIWRVARPSTVYKLDVGLGFQAYIWENYRLYSTFFLLTPILRQFVISLLRRHQVKNANMSDLK